MSDRHPGVSSSELKVEYERLKEEQEKATETSAQNFNKKRGITAEMKQFKEQKEEAERYENLLEQRVWNGTLGAPGGFANIDLPDVGWRYSAPFIMETVSYR